MLSTTSIQKLVCVVLVWLAPTLSYAKEISAPPTGKVFDLLLQNDSDNKKEYSSQAFVVDSDGILVTPFHSIAQAVPGASEPSPPYLLFLDVDRQRLPARVIAFDATSDLALIWVSHRFSSAFLMATQPPAPGEKIYLVGINAQKEVTPVEGTFGELKRSGPLTRYLISTRFNDRVSDNLVLNSGGEVIGLSNKNLVPIRVQEASYFALTPGTQIIELIRRSKVAGRKIASSTPAEEIVRQLDFTFSPWLNEWKTRQWSGPPNPTFDHFQLGTAAPNLACQEDPTPVPVGVRRIECANDFSFPISHQREGGLIQMTYTANSNKPIGQTKMSLARDFEKVNGNGDERINYICHHRYVSTSQNLELLTEYCISPVTKVSGFYNFLLTASTATSPHGLFAELHLQGFSLFGIQQMTDTFLNGMREAHTP
jgi:hypothetical protein